MRLADLVKERVRVLLGVSAFAETSEERSESYAPKQKTIDMMRQIFGGNIQQPPITKLEWFLSDLAAAQALADTGDLSMAGQLWRAMRRDGTIKGLLGIRTKGLVRLPKQFYGAEDIARLLRSMNGTRSVFDDMHPPSELAQLAADGIGLGIGIAERVPVQGRSYPVMVRLDPEFLRFRWWENKWYYNSVAGAIPITPGDGKWVLHIPGGRMQPWTSGDIWALGRDFINKEHALLHRSNYSAKLANAARAAVAPPGANESQRKGWLAEVIAWSLNTVFEMPVGWDVKLIESNGRGYDVFKDEIATSDNSIMITLAGQVVTVTGGVGFSNADIFRVILGYLIEDTAEALAFTLNTQSLPQWVAETPQWGIKRIANTPIVRWDVNTPSDQAKAAATMGQAAAAITQLNVALQPYGRTVDIDELAVRFNIPLLAERIETLPGPAAPPPAENANAATEEDINRALTSEDEEEQEAAE